MRQTSSTRRSSRELRPLIVTAARDLFRDQGYSGSTTRDIAARAGVTESVVFRHFRSKAEIYEEAVLSPFIQLMDQFVDRWTALPHDQIDPIEHGRAWVTDLYRLCVDNRDLMRVLTTADTGGHSQADSENVMLPVRKHLADMQATLEGFIAQDGGSVIDLGLALRLTMALVLGAAVFDAELFGDAYDRTALPDHLMNFILEGIGYVPPASGEPPWRRRRE